MTLAEIIAKAKDDKDFRKSIVVWAKDTEEGKEILSNFSEAEYEKKVKDKISEIHTGYDNDIFEVLGQKKKGEQKSYDFVKELAGELKELREKKDSLDSNEKVKELQAQIKKMQNDGSVNEHWKDIYDKALAKFEQEKEELIGKLESKEKEYLGAQVSSDLMAGKAGLSFMEGLPKEAIEAMIKVHESTILENAKIIDGKVVYHKEDGSPWMNKDTYKPVTAEDIWREKLGTVISNDQPGGNKGGGAKPNLSSGSVVDTGTGDDTKKLVLDRKAFSTKLEFNTLADETLRKQGVAVGSKEYKEMISNAYNEYEVSELDLK